MSACYNKAIYNVHKKWIDFGMVTNYNNTICNVHRKWTIHPPNGDIEQLLDIERTLNRDARTTNPLHPTTSTIVPLLVHPCWIFVRDSGIIKQK